MGGSLTDADLADYHWLVGDAARPYLRRAAGHIGPLATLAKSLRRDLAVGRACLVLEQHVLRQRARDKFADPEQLFFTRRGLEQATGQPLARFKAGRFETSETVADLCCGIGGDLLELSARGDAVGVERDGVTALLATANLHQTGRSGWRVECQDVRLWAGTDAAAWHLDPDRRSLGSRASQPERYEPGPDEVWRLLAINPRGAVKLAPAARLADERWRQAELEWIAFDRQCRQLMAWFGPLARSPGQRVATLLGPGGHVASRIEGSGRQGLQPAAAIGRYLYEPHAGVLAAGLAGTLAARHGLTAVAADGGYLTGEDPVSDRSCERFEVLEVLPYDARRIKAVLRQRSVGPLEIKKRGVAELPESLRRRLRVPGPDRAVLILARTERGTTAILARRG